MTQWFPFITSDISLLTPYIEDYALANYIVQVIISGLEETIHLSFKAKSRPIHAFLSHVLLTCSYWGLD